MSNKKIAVCFYGLSTGRNDKDVCVKGIEESYNTIKQNIIKNMECDTFFHTWIDDDIDNKKYLLGLYRPKKYLFQKKIDSHNDKKGKLYSVKSRWLSHKKVTELVNEYSIENDMNYDIIFITRFDCVFYSDFKLNELDVTNHLYISNWETPEKTTRECISRHGICDLWWFGNLESINRLKDIFDKIDNYLRYCELSNHQLSYYHIRINNIPIKAHQYLGKDFNISHPIAKPRLWSRRPPRKALVWS